MTMTSEQKKGPMIIARSPDMEDERSSTTLVAEAGESFFGVNSGGELTAFSELFLSDDNEDRGGFVLRIEIPNTGGDFIPHAVNTEDGVEIHFCGSSEGEAVIKSIRSLLNKLTSIPKPHCIP